jgi:hypothetical protein
MGGNGSAGVFSTSDMGGWVRVFPADMSHLPADLHLFLSQTLTDFFRERPDRHLRCVVPINNQAGRTVELHAWYDVHVFPVMQGPVRSAPAH